jgi:hypothetical protein
MIMIMNLFLNMNQIHPKIIILQLMILVLSMELVVCVYKKQYKHNFIRLLIASNKVNNQRRRKRRQTTTSMYYFYFNRHSK